MRTLPTLLLGAALVPSHAFAQVLSCTGPERLFVGAVVGRSSPSFDLDSVAISPRPGSVSVRGGVQVGGRGDITVVGPLRVRVEGWTTRWEVERRMYSPINGQIESITSEGQMSASHVGASVGLRGGRAPVCWQVLAGGGLYSLSYRDITSRRSGAALTAGMDFPGGVSGRGRVQIEVQLHIIDTQNHSPVSGTQALAAALVAGWGIRF